MDIQTIWHFVAWLAGCSIPAVVLIYVLKRLVKAATDRITTVVDAYAGERAKLVRERALALRYREQGSVRRRGGANDLILR